MQPSASGCRGESQEQCTSKTVYIMPKSSETGSWQQDLNWLYTATSFGKEPGQSLEHAGKRRVALVLPLASPVSHNVLEGLRHRDLVGRLPCGFNFTDVDLELFHLNAVKVECIVHNCMAQDLIVGDLFFHLVEFGRVGQMMLQKLQNSQRQPPWIDLSRHTALWAFETFLYRLRSRVNSASCRSRYLRNP